MATKPGRTRTQLEVHSMFEPSRLEQACLQQAYAQLVPVLHRSLRRAVPDPVLSPSAPQAERKLP